MASLRVSALWAPYLARKSWDGWGYEYTPGFSLASLPFLQVSFKFRPNRTLVIACGIIASGQFGCGVICISQFGVGLLSLSKFTLAGFALAQSRLAYSLIAQFGGHFAEERVQLVSKLSWLQGVLLQSAPANGR